MYARTPIFLSFIVLLCSACERAAIQTAHDTRQADMDAYCSERGQEALSDDEKLSEVKAFYSWKIHTCVQIEVETADPNWSYRLVDVSEGFFRGSQTVKSALPLTVYHHNYSGLETVHAEGFWDATDSSKDRQLAELIAVKLDCNSSEKMCREQDAQLFGGLLQPDSVEYAISKWDGAGIVADGPEKGLCGIGQRLSINFASNSVIVTDYPTKDGGRADCKPFQTANSYSLHAGNIGIMSQDEIFGCSKSGINNAIIAKVIEFHGHVSDKNYSLWLDNGEGGPPATVKTPGHVYSQTECRSEMDKTLAKLRSGE
jgi:hypothetical protein